MNPKTEQRAMAITVPICQAGTYRISFDLNVGGESERFDETVYFEDVGVYIVRFLCTPLLTDTPSQKLNKVSK